MPPIRIYLTTWCPYCHRAKKLLDRKGAAYEEIDVDRLEGGRFAMAKLAGGRRTVPQIFIGDRHVGGCDDLHALDRKGELDPLLGD